MPNANNRLRQIQREITDYIALHILADEDVAELTSTTPLVTSGVLDSITTVKLVAYLEETYSIEFAAHEIDIDYLNTIEDLAALIQSKTSVA